MGEKWEEGACRGCTRWGNENGGAGGAGEVIGGLRSLE